MKRQLRKAKSATRGPAQRQPGKSVEAEEEDQAAEDRGQSRFPAEPHREKPGNCGNEQGIDRDHCWGQRDAPGHRRHGADHADAERQDEEIEEVVLEALQRIGGTIT